MGASRLLRGAEKAKATPSLSLWRVLSPRRSRDEVPHGQAAPARSGHKSTIAHADVAPLKESDKVAPPAPRPLLRGKTPGAAASCLECVENSTHYFQFIDVRAANVYAKKLHFSSFVSNCEQMLFH